MPSPRHTQTEVQVFSAIQWYSERAVEQSRGDGLVKASLSIPDSGLHVAPQNEPREQSSLLWVDGLVAEALQVEQCLGSIARSELPAPLIAHTPHILGRHYQFTSAEVLANLPHSILALSGLAGPLAEQALTSGTPSCISCGEVVTRAATPLIMLESIADDFESATVSLSAHGARPQLEDWAVRTGFRITGEPDHPWSTILLESGVCTRTWLAQLTPIVRSLWRMPEIFFSCSSQSATRYYSRYGWCARCQKTGPSITTSQLEKLLRSPIQGEHSRDPVYIAARSLSVHAAQHAGNHDSALASTQCLTPLTVEEILTSPIASLACDHSAPLRNLCALLRKADLGKYTLWTSPCELSSRQVARLSLAMSLYQTADTASVVVIDLPAGILSGCDELLHELTQTDSTHPRVVVSLNEPCSLHDNAQPAGPSTAEAIGRHREHVTLTPSSQTLPTPEPGKVIVVHCEGRNLTQPRYHHALKVSPSDFQSVGSAAPSSNPPSTAATLTHSDSIHQHIPVFPERTTTKRVLADELGLLPGLAKLYASSVDARMSGLAPKDFTFSSSKKHPHLCPGCHGLGVAFTINPILPRPLAAACLLCHGRRFKEPVSSTMFRGTSYSTLLNRSIAESQQILNSLSRCREALECIELLHLAHLPLGMPVALLSSSERRRLLVAQAVLSSNTTRPLTIAVEDPLLGFAPKHLHGLRALQLSPTFSKRCGWLELCSAPPPL